jgi:hypothetical protein
VYLTRPGLWLGLGIRFSVWPGRVRRIGTVLRLFAGSCPAWREARTCSVSRLPSRSCIPVTTRSQERCSCACRALTRCRRAAGPLSSPPGTGSRPERAGRAGEQVMADSLRERMIAACSAQPGSAEDYPFGDEVAVFKIAGKMLALVTPGRPPAASASNAPRISRPGCAAGMSRSPWATTSASGTGTQSRSTARYPRMNFLTRSVIPTSWWWPACSGPNGTG